MSKTMIGNDAFVLPMAQAILGSHHAGRPNYMALAWLTRANHKPCIMGICVHKSHASFEDILETRQFSLNFPTRSMHVVTDYVGLVSGRRTDKSEVFSSFYGELDAAPLIEECPLCMACKVVEMMEFPTNSFIFGEVAQVFCNEDCLANGMPDIAKLNPLLLSMPDNRYWSLGEAVGKAWSDGKVMKQK